MKNKKIISYPHVLYTNSGHQAVVSNPQKGHYRFHVLNPKGYPEFDWLEDNFKGIPALVIKDNNRIDRVKDDLLNTFWNLAD